MGKGTIRSKNCWRSKTTMQILAGIVLSACIVALSAAQSVRHYCVYFVNCATSKCLECAAHIVVLHAASRHIWTGHRRVWIRVSPIRRLWQRRDTADFRGTSKCMHPSNL